MAAAQDNRYIRVPEASSRNAPISSSAVTNATPYMRTRSPLPAPRTLGGRAVDVLEPIGLRADRAAPAALSGAPGARAPGAPGCTIR